MSSKIKVDTIENVAGSGNVSLGSGHNLVVPGTVSVTGASTLTGGVTSSSAHTVTTSTHANASVFKSTGHTQLFLQDTDASSNYQFWGLQNSGGDINILRCNDDRASGFVTPMTITQEGYVNLPNNPYVQFQGGSNGNTSITHGEYFGNTTQGNPAFSTSGSNLARMQGITYNSSNGLFTVPEGGLYMIYFQGYYNGSATAVRVDIICNGVQMALGHMGSQVGTVGTSFAGTLAANDTVGFRSIGGSGGTVQDWYMGVSHMLGYIVKVA